MVDFKQTGTIISSGFFRVITSVVDFWVWIIMSVVEFWVWVGEKIIEIHHDFASVNHDNNRGWIYQFFKRLYHLPILGWSLKTDIIFKPKEFGGSGACYVNEEWTTLNLRELSSRGYVPAHGYHDNILWWGVKHYLKFHGGHISDNRGNLQTATTLNNSMKSNSDRQFKRGLSRSALPTMDLQKIMILAVIGIGVVVGMYFMGWI